MEKNLALTTFRQFIDEDIFVIACTDTRNELKEADNLMPEERVKALINIIGKFKNPAKETIITPWPVVNLHLGETIGGEVFFDIEGQDFRRILPAPAMIDHQGKGILSDIHTDVFWDENAKVLEINSKSGVYPLFLAYSMYKIHCSMEGGMVFEVDVWKRILEKNIFVLCQTEMAVKITNRVLRGFHLDWKTNCIYKENLIESFLEHYKSDKETINEINTPKYWGLNGDEMIKFTLAASNPPYQGSSHAQIYPLFYHTAIEVADTVSMIFPSNWQEASKKSAKGLSRMNNKTIKRDHQIVFIDNRKGVFDGIAGAAETNIVLWKREYDNGLDGSQKVFTEGKDPVITTFNIEVADIERIPEISELCSCVQSDGFSSFEMSKFDIFRIPSNIFKQSHAGSFSEQRVANDDIKIWGIDGKRIEKYHTNDFELIQIKKKNGSIDHEDYVSKSTGFKFRNSSFFNRYKIIIPLLWGNMDAAAGIGGSYADIAIAKPGDICSYSYNVCGGSDTKEEAIRIAKYMLTKFFRALLAYNKMGKHATSDTFLAVPSQDFHEDWWNKSIADIDEHLFEKYNVPEPIRSFVRNNIQTRTEENIVNL